MKTVYWFGLRNYLPWIGNTRVRYGLGFILLMLMVAVFNYNVWDKSQEIHIKSHLLVPNGNWNADLHDVRGQGQNHGQGNEDETSNRSLGSRADLTDAQQLTLRLLDEQYHDKVRSLLTQINTLEEELDFVQKKIEKGQEGLTEENHERVGIEHEKQLPVNTKVFPPEMKYSSEYEVVPFHWYNGSHVMSSTDINNVYEVGGKEQTELLKLTHTFSNINLAKEQDRIAASLFQGGILRDLPGVGRHYEMLHREPAFKNVSDVMTRMTFVEPFAYLREAGNISVDVQSPVVNIIVSMNSYGAMFSNFVDIIKETIVGQGDSVHLTMVFFGQNGLEDVRNKLSDVSRKTSDFLKYEIVTVNETFSQSRGMYIGAHHWNGSHDVIFLFADVDVALSLSAIAGCRMFTREGQSVYYPIPFGLYDPNLIYTIMFQEKVPKIRNQLRINIDKGFWQTHHYDVSCQHHSDFISMSSEISRFPLDLGSVGLQLSRSYHQSGLLVYRIPDPSVFHMWHEKHCDPTLLDKQFNHCLEDKSLSKGSHTQLGFLAFRQGIDISRQ